MFTCDKLKDTLMHLYFSSVYLFIYYRKS